MAPVGACGSLRQLFDMAISMQTLLYAGNKGYSKTRINMETLNTQHKQPSKG